MNIHQLKPKTKRTYAKRVGRGGKRGTTSGKGTKGQASRAGAGIKTGFRGGDNRIWQLFPKQRGASKKPGNNSPHRKHRFFQLKHDKPTAINLDAFDKFSEGQEITAQMLIDKGIIENTTDTVKVLGNGVLKKKVTLKGFAFSDSAKEKITKAGGKIV
ncbi:MAG: 50S ribosomal protein L15 [Candidatus Pacebacteria bacterium]|nr:50S ribosomal protein L15 [Candidatus Paceibacterota bacterium]